MKKNQIHPAAIRSRNCLVEGLLKLMETRPYEEISVKDITEESVLTRRTFYAHFKSKEDVLDYKLTALNDQLIDLIKKQAHQNHEAIARLYFNFWTSHLSLLKLMKNQSLLPLLFDNFEKNIRDIRLLFGCDLSKANINYARYSSAIFTGILSGMLSTWIENDGRDSVDTLVDMLKLTLDKLSLNFHQ